MAVPFLVDPLACRITSAPREKYFDACDLDLTEWSRESFGLDLKLENDAHAACLGEWRHGAGQGVDDLVMFTLGTGIGCSVILRGHPLRGKRHQAGVLCGHMISDPEGAPCTCCPANGCFESLSASASLGGHARRHPDFARSPLSALTEIDFKAVFDHAASGDPTSTAVRDKVIRYWAALAVNACAAYDPDLILIGGAVSAAAPVILPALRDYVNHHAWTTQPPRIECARLGNQAGTVGIASVFQHPVRYL
jgi:glucokinase